MLLSLLKDRRLWLLALFSLLVLIVGRFALPDTLALDWVKRTGFWFMLALFVASLAALWRFLRNIPTESWTAWRDWRAWALLGLATLVWHAHEKQGFKILADEALLLGTSQGLHLQREAGYGVRATDVRGPFELLQTVLDKRPLFFPFLVSTLHDWTGYRPTNPFWLNTGLGVVLLALIYGLGRRLGGHTAAGVVAVLWLAGIPLFAQQAASGGFDLLNVTLVAAWLWLAIFYAEQRDPRTQDAFILVAVMLGSTRYESLLYLIPTAILLLWAWSQEGRARLTPLTWLAPVLLLPTLWLNQAFSANQGFWEMQSVGAQHPFGLGFLPENLGHALAHFFSFDGFQPNSPGFGALGLIALPLLLIWAMRIARAPGGLAAGDVGLLAGLSGLMAGTALMMLYFWGQFDHPVISRLSMPTQLLMLVALIVVAARLAGGGRKIWFGLAIAALLNLVLWSLPVMARNAYGREYSPRQAYAWREEFLTYQTSRNLLVIDRDSQFWITRNISATPIAQAQMRRDGIAFHFRNHSFNDIFVFQMLKVDPETGTASVLPEDELGPGYTLEKVAEHRVALFNLARISRVTQVDGIAKTPLPTTPPETTPTSDEANVVRNAYLQEWMRNLP